MIRELITLLTVLRARMHHTLRVRHLLCMMQSGPQSTEAAAELAPPATSAAHPTLDPGSPRSQGSFNIFNLSPQDFSLSPLHRGHNDSQQVPIG